MATTLLTSCHLVYLNNRYHDPTLGMFVSVDPLVTITGEAYIYGAANPIRFSDPTGLDPDTSATIRNKAEERGYCTASSSASCVRDPGVTQREDISDRLPERYRPFLERGRGGDKAKVGYYTQEIEPGEDLRCALKRSGCVWEAFGLWKLKNDVEASSILADNRDGTLGNAQKHILLAAALTWSRGEAEAREILEAHENIVNGRLLEGQGFDEHRQMDLINNETGIQLGLDTLALHGEPWDPYFFQDVFPYLEQQVALGMYQPVYFRRVDSSSAGGYYS